MSDYRIGEVSSRLGLSVDTLRYYERIGLLPRVARNRSGLRIYMDEDLSRLEFIQRAQHMNFSLTEIGTLLKFRDNPERSRRDVRELTVRKLDEIDRRLESLDALRRELRSLAKLCASANHGCPIISGLEGKSTRRQRNAGRR